VRLATDVDGFGKVFFCKRFEGSEEALPAFIPTFHDPGRIVACLMHKLKRALAVGFFTIVGQKISPAREKVAADVLNQNSNAVGIIVVIFFQVSKECSIIIS
jgi:hypothetical protein